MNYEKLDIPDSLWNDYNPTTICTNLLIERVLIRFPKKATYYGNEITKQEYLDKVIKTSNI